MSGWRLIVRKEWRSLIGGERSMFMLYAVVVVLWSLLFVGTSMNAAPYGIVLWLLPFSVILVSNFAQGVFVAERINGAIEILLTCGVSRRSIVVGKIAFVIVLALVMGLLCFLLSRVWLLVGGAAWQPSGLWAQYALLFVASVSLNACSMACLSVLLPNPRLSHFVNFLGVAVILGVYYPLMPRLPSPVLLLALLLLAGAGGVLGAALSIAKGERMARPVSM